TPVHRAIFGGSPWQGLSRHTYGLIDEVPLALLRQIGLDVSVSPISGLREVLEVLGFKWLTSSMRRILRADRCRSDILNQDGYSPLPGHRRWVAAALERAILPGEQQARPRLLHTTLRRADSWCWPSSSSAGGPLPGVAAMWL